MSDRWVPARREDFVRDFVRDYCQVFLILAEQARRFEHDGSMSYSGLRELMGEAMRKGVFWRLKDTAHHLFRASPDAGETGTLPADWRFAASPHPSGDARRAAQEGSPQQLIPAQRAADEQVTGKTLNFREQHG